ncbi:MAG: YCF48-related protein [Candidatus Sulfotelmatobacter sp.]
MKRVPQIVSERLKAAAPAVEHPDAGVLTAFSERLLLQAERMIVLEHLARCGECREIVALALPASEPVQQIARPALGYTAWLTWPVLRWGLIAAGLVAITSFGVMQYQRRSSTTAYNTRRSEAAGKITNALPLSPSLSQPAEDHAKLQAPPPTEQRDLVSSNAGSAEVAAPMPAQRKARQAGVTPIGGPLGGPPVQSQQNTNNFQQQGVVQALPSQLAKQLHPGQLPANLPAPSRSQFVDNSSSQASTDLGIPVLESQRMDQQPIHGALAESRIERIKPAGTSSNMSALKVLPPDVSPANAPAPAPLDQKSQDAGSSGVPMRWTISPAGGLLRSLDQGSTWQKVDVNNSSPAAASLSPMNPPSRAKEATNERAVSNDSLAKDRLTQDKGSLAKEDAISLIFRAVASNGPDVWAGASGGLLYHSSDAGAHWARVVPSASGLSLTGDIVNLEFLDPQHGRVVTSTPEVWTTSDAGQSWLKQ